MRSHWWWKVILLLSISTVGCVTHTERIPYHRYYDPPENESVLDELRREFGWQKPPPWVREEPLYTKAARRVKETVTKWFQEDESTGSRSGGLQTVQEFQRAQNEAIQRLQQQKTGDISSADESHGVTNDSFPSDVGAAASEE